MCKRDIYPMDTFYLEEVNMKTFFLILMNFHRIPELLQKEKDLDEVHALIVTPRVAPAETTVEHLQSKKE